MRINLATDLSSRDGTVEQDAKLLNAYVEVKGDASAVRSRPTAHGGVPVGSGTAQGGYGTVLFWGDTAYTIDSNTGTTWNAGTSYSIGDHVSVGFVDYWALTNNTNSNPTTNPSDWDSVYIPSRPKTYATLVGGLLTATRANGAGSNVLSTMTKTTGKWYYEITRTGPMDTYSSVTYGVNPSFCTLNQTIGAKCLDDPAFSTLEVRKHLCGSDISTLAGKVPPAIGEVVGVAFDCDNGTVFVFINGVNVMGAGVALYDNGAQATFTPSIFLDGDTITANFGASAFTYAPPSGFKSGVYTV